jgi:hypothetical protein
MVIHSEARWSGTQGEASHAAHPEIPPPIMGKMGKHIEHFLHNETRGGFKSTQNVIFTVLIPAKVLP